MAQFSIALCWDLPSAWAWSFPFSNTTLEKPLFTQLAWCLPCANCSSATKGAEESGICWGLSCMNYNEFIFLWLLKFLIICSLFIYYSVDCLFSNTPFLEVSFMPDVLPPNGSMEVPITFYPREAMRYHEKVVFKINECSMQVVEIKGQGIELKVRKRKLTVLSKWPACHHAFLICLDGLEVAFSLGFGFPRLMLRIQS